MANPEHLPNSAERGIESQNAAAERSNELLKSAERSVETSPEEKAERVAEARTETKEALMGRESGGAEKRRASSDRAPSLPHATKKQRADSYAATMRQIQSEMNRSSRTFSKVIHNPTVEKLSDAIGSSAARPNAVLAGSMAATFLTLTVFLIAKQYGYRLSGFETIATFLLGWALGLIYDYARLMLPTKR
ncbi:TPA: hypothetical protein DCF80_01470 [Candidatus Saccharibacteria bacterium]|nr:hypothetical protein [Candidatus Saccharibacteria bacterium]HRK41269.1 hypothetical protein [Candidatus Saccharibacteria bacterium]